MESKNRFLNDIKFVSILGVWGFIVVSICLAVFLVTLTINSSDQKGEYSTNRVTLVGEGEVFSAPDIAVFNYTVTEVSEDVASAQEMATTKSNKIIEILKESEIEEKDIKTITYNISPKYEWIPEPCIGGGYCPGGKNEIVGQKVSQTVEVTIRDLEKAGDVLSKIGNQEIANISSLRFDIDDDDTLKSEARGLAIDDAKEKAKKLAEQLGIEIEQVIGFSEDSYYPRGLGGMEKVYMEADTVDMVASPELPTGENIIKSRVQITFEIE